MPGPNDDPFGLNTISHGQQLFKIVSSGTVPERIVSVAGSYTFKHALFQGQNAPQVDNTGSVAVGVVAGGQPMQIIAGGERFFEAPNWGVMDLYDFYASVQVDGEGIGVTYW